MVKPQYQEEAPAKEEAAVDLAIHAVCQDPLEQVELRVSPAGPENLEHQDCQETPENRQFNLASQSLHHHANLVHKVRQDLPDHQDHQEMLDNPAPQETQEAILHQESQDQRDHQDLQDHQDNQEHQENQAHQHKAPRLKQELRDHQETPDHQDLQDHQDSQETTQGQDQQDQKDHPDHQDHQETMDNLEHLVKVEHQEMQEKRVSARNTAPSMVESSSRTELDVVKLEWPAGVGLFGVPTTLAHFTLLLFIQHKHQKISFNGNVLNLA